MTDSAADAAASADAMVGYRELADFAAALFAAAGMTHEHAAMAADVLAWAEFRGVDSHGLERIPRYLELMANGQMNAAARPAIRDAAGAAFTVDAERASGLVAMTIAADEAGRRARQSGVAMGLVSKTTHTGAIGFYADRLARKGLAAIVMAAGMPLMAWPGTRAASISTSPLAIGVPGGPSGAIVFDMSTAIASSGRLKAAMRAKRPLPEGYALDSAGEPTTDAAKAAISLPVGEAKGAGLSLMIEILASVLGASPIVSEQAPQGAKRVHAGNGLIIAIDIARFRPLADFTGDVDALVDVVRSMPRFEGAPVPRMPGERAGAELAARMRSGTPINARLRAALAEKAKELGVTPPPALLV